MADFVIYEDHVAPVIIGAVPVVVALKGGQLITDTEFPIAALFAAGFKMVQLNVTMPTLGALVAVRVITDLGAGVYTPTDGTKRIFVECVGGGGGGGGATFAAGGGGSPSTEAYGGGGGGGGYSAKLVTLDPAETYSYVVGAGGAGGSIAPTAGSTGGGTMFADGSFLEVVGSGGLGGQPLAAGSTVVQVAGGAGGVPFGGDIDLPGAYGGNGVRINGSFGWSGFGGASGKGFGAQARPRESGADAGNLYGGGGSGAGAGSASTAGGDGAQGVIVIWEYA